MKARKVKGLDPDGPLDANLRRIVAVRVAELHSFGKAVLDPSDVEALHDMRIAAKRVRYSESMFDVLVYLYENYWRPDACPDHDQLTRKLSSVGFESDEIQEALSWLDGRDGSDLYPARALNAVGTDLEICDLNNDGVTSGIDFTLLKNNFGTAGAAANCP